MIWMRALRAELRKLTTTKLPWGFVGVVALLASGVALAVIVGSDYQDAEGFMGTAADQASLLAFGGNAFMIAAPFGAIAAAREFSHGTIVPTLLVDPLRRRAVGTQVMAIAIGGAVLGLIGEGLALVAGILSFPAAGYDMLVAGGTIVRLFAAAMVAGAFGGILGAGIGSIVRNTGGAVMATFLVTMILPPLGAQTFSWVLDWVPTTLIWVLAGTGSEHAVPIAFAALLGWAAIPVGVALATVERRDIV